MMKPQPITSRGFPKSGARPGVGLAGLVALLFALAVVLFEVRAFAQDGAPSRFGSPLAEAVRSDTAMLCEVESRVIGTTGHAVSRAAVEERVANLAAAFADKGVRVWTQEFPVLAPVTIEAWLEISEGPWAGRHAVFPIYPSSARLNTTPAEGVTGSFQYIGVGELRDFPAKSLQKQIAVMEATGGRKWRTAAGFGAAAVLFLGNPNFINNDFSAFVSWHPYYLPRLYLPDGPLADAIRKGEAKAGKLYSRAEWRTVTARNTYVLVPPVNRSRPRPAIAVAVQLDAMSFVPDQCQGADAAIDLAANLHYMRSFMENPPEEHPLLFTFLDAHSIHMQGIRQMLGSLALFPRDKRKMLDYDRKREQEYRQYLDLARELDAMENPDLRVHEARYRLLHSMVKDAASMDVTRVDSQIQPRRVELFGATGERRAELQAQVNALALERANINSVRTRMLSRPRRGSEGNLAPVSEELRPLAVDLWRRVRERVEGQYQQAKLRLDMDEAREALRAEMTQALGLNPETDRMIGFMIGLDLSDAGLAAGPMLQDHMYLISDLSNSDLLVDWLEERVRLEGDKIWPGELLQAIDLSPRTSIFAPDSFNMNRIARLTAPCTSFNVPSLSWYTLDGVRQRLDTPEDRFDRLDWDRVAPQIEATYLLLRRLARDAQFSPAPQIVGQWGFVSGTIVDQAPGEPLPRLPMEGFVCTLLMGQGGGVGKTQSPGWRGNIPGMRRLEFALTGPDGEFVFDFIPGTVEPSAYSDYCRYLLQAFKFDETGATIRALDMMKQGKGTQLKANVQSTTQAPLRAVVFSCREASVYQLEDPRFLLDLANPTILDARRGSVPQRMNYSITEGGMRMLLEPDVRWAAILRAGVTGNRMALLNFAPLEQARNMSAREAIRGFGMSESLPSHPLHVGAWDYYRLDMLRVEEYRKAGITSKAIEEIQARTLELLEAADAALEADDGGEVMRAATAALANEVRAYDAIRALANDVVRAAIFLLLALAPFAFAMERLAYATPRIIRQIVVTGVIFFFMTGILWSFHPAFRISSQPMVIIMAFAIIFMSLLVISMILVKFKTGLDEMRLDRAESSGARSSGIGLAVTALKLGIANMRKRKLRTALTGMAVVLITFALLCFMSTSSYTGSREFSVPNVSSPYTGILIRQPAYRNIDPKALDYIQNILGPDKELSTRYWWQNPHSETWRIILTNPANNKRTDVLAGVGLSPVEGQLSRVSEVCRDWDRFSKTQGVYLPEDVAKQLEAKPGDAILIAGSQFELINVFNPKEFDEKVRGLDGSPLTPTDYTTVGQLERQENLKGNWSQEQLSVELMSGEGLEVSQDLPKMPSDHVIVLPAAWFQQNNLGNLRSIGLRTESFEAARTLAIQLIRRFAFPIYLAAAPGSGDSPEEIAGEVRVMATTPLIARPPKSIFIPLIIAGFIIFNTMLSSIAERKREIYVYTSLGLSPTHVGILFLSEAITYGLMGSIFGYVVGQGLATLLSHYNLLAGITLNYSGTQAIAVMVLVMGVVVVSSLVPAYLAGRLATPGNALIWRVPEPKGDVITDILPFTVTHQTANGTIAFLYEYFAAHREGGIGSFTTDYLHIYESGKGAGGGMSPDRSGKPEPRLGLGGTVWLAPYDLGVRQEFDFSVEDTEDPDVLGLRITLRRGAGQTGNWKRLNKVFLGKLRRQLLGWRNLKPERVMRYIDGVEELRSRGMEVNRHIEV